jgi:hypothetical protein
MTVEGGILRAAVVGGMIYFFHIPYWRTVSRRASYAERSTKG